MIYKNGKNVTAIYKGSTPITKIYKGLQVIWEAFKNLIVSGVTPLVLPNSIGEPMIDYQIDGNSIQASDPTPDYPIEVQSVGDKTINLAPKLTDMTKNGVSLTVESDGTITLNGTCTASENFVSEKFYLGDNTYSLSDFAYGDFGDNSFVRSQIYSPSSSSDIAIANNTDSDYVRSVALSSANDYVVRIRIQKGHTYNNCKLKIMLVVGEYTKNTMPPYVPFGYKVPVTITGNLFNYDSDENLIRAVYGSYEKNDNGYIVTATTGTSSAFRLQMLVPMSKFKLGETYTISFDATNVRSLAIGEADDGSDTSSFNKYHKGTIANPKEITFTISERTKSYVNFFFYGETHSIGAVMNIQNIIIVNSDKPSTYQPYTEPVTTNIYLDEPLRSVGTYSDYIDYANQKVVRNIDSLTLTTSTGFNVSALSDGTKFVAFTTISLANGLTVSSSDTMSNYFQNVLTASDGNSGVYRAGTTSANKAHFIFGLNTYFGIDDTDTTNAMKLTKFRTWLSGLNEPVKIYFHLATPIEETITLPTISTISGTCVVDTETTVTPSNIEVTYKGK